MTAEDVRKLLKRECERAGGQKAWGKSRGISLSHVNDAVNGRKAPGPSICAALGLERVVTYRRVRS